MKLLSAFSSALGCAIAAALCFACSSSSTNGVDASGGKGGSAGTTASGGSSGSSCESGKLTCGGHCSDVASDPENCGACGHSCLGGDCAARMCQPIVLADNVGYAADLAIDASFVYWSSWGTNANFSDGGVFKCPLSGCGSAPTVVAHDPNEPSSIAIDASNVYFGNHGDGTIGKCPLAGCGAYETIASSIGDPRGIAIENGALFWVDATNSKLYKCSANSCNDAPLALVSSSVLSTPFRVVTDSKNAYVSGGKIVKVPLDGISGYTELATGDVARGIAVSATDVFWATYKAGNGALEKCAIAGCSETPTEIIGDRNNPHDIALDSGHIYWSDQGAGLIMSCPLSGCPADPVPLATQQAEPLRIAVDDTAIYWVNSGAGKGSVMKLAK